MSANGPGDGTGDSGDSGDPAPGYPGSGTGDGGDALPGAQMSCFYPEGDPDALPAGTIEHVLEVFEEQDAWHVRLTLDPNFVDNTYGEGSLFWGNRGHRFSDIDKSDHAELILTDGDGEVAMQFKIDYIAPDSSAPSGYASQGVTGSDGAMIVGSADQVLQTRTSIDRNLNERGYSEYISTSPATDENYTPNPDAPEWDYRYVYEAWISTDAFGSAGFGDPAIEYIHASPSKDDKDTWEVDPDPCPPDWDPECNDPDGCDNEPNDCTDDPYGCPDGGTGDPDGDDPDGDCNDPDGCDNEPNDCTDDPDGCPDGGTDDPGTDNPDQCVEDTDCPTGEFCNEGTCSPIIE